jgi:hypothetical protein
LPVPAVDVPPVAALADRVCAAGPLRAAALGVLPVAWVSSAAQVAAAPEQERV